MKKIVIILFCLLFVVSCSEPTDVASKTYQYVIAISNHSQHTIGFNLQSDRYKILRETDNTVIYRSYNYNDTTSPLNELPNEIVVSFDDEIFMTYQVGDTFHSPFNEQSYEIEDRMIGTERYKSVDFAFTDADYEYAKTNGFNAVEQLKCRQS